MESTSAHERSDTILPGPPVDLTGLYRGNLEWLNARTIYLTRHGSHAYGTNVATSDEDYKGIAIAPLSYYLGFNSRFEQAETKTPDLVVYDVRKFFKLAADCNPNIIEVLFAEMTDVVQINSFGDDVRKLRRAFLSRRAGARFGGYATAQLHKIKIHHNPGAVREGRNPVRAELEALHGYDTKHAIHLVRLLRMAREILTDGRVIVKRPDADELIAIREGAWPYADLLAWADSELAGLAQLIARSPLPVDPDINRLDGFCADLIHRYTQAHG